MAKRKSRCLDRPTSYEVVGRNLAHDARLLRLVSAPDDALVARACELALRDPARVEALCAGIIDKLIAQRPQVAAAVA